LDKALGGEEAGEEGSEEGLVTFSFFFFIALPPTPPPAAAAAAPATPAAAADGVEGEADLSRTQGSPPSLPPSSEVGAGAITSTTLAMASRKI